MAFAAPAKSHMAHLKRKRDKWASYDKLVGGHDKMVSLCNLQERAHAKAVLRDYDGIGKKKAEILLDRYRTQDRQELTSAQEIEAPPTAQEFQGPPTTQASATSPSAQEFEAPPTTQASAAPPPAAPPFTAPSSTQAKEHDRRFLVWGLLREHLTQSDGANKHLCDNLIKCEKDKKAKYLSQFLADTDCVWADYAKLRDISVPDIKQKLCRTYAKHVVKLCSRRNDAEHASRQMQPLLRALPDDPMCLQKHLKCPFRDVDNYALQLGWWTRDSDVRCRAAVMHHWTEIHEKDRCTAVARKNLWEKLVMWGKIDGRIDDIDAFTRRVDNAVAFLEDADELVVFSGEFGTDQQLITTPQWLQFARDIVEFVKQDVPCDRVYKSEYNVDLTYDEAGNFTTHALNLLIDDAIKAANLEFLPSNEQLSCIHMIMQQRVSIITGEGGTGKTNVCAKIAHEIAKRLGCIIICLATPTKAANEQLVHSLECDEDDVYTIDSLIYTAGGAILSGLERNVLTEGPTDDVEYFSDDDDNDMDDADFRPVAVQPQQVRKRVFVFLDELSMVGTKKLAKLFRLFYRFSHSHDFRVVVIGDGSQLQPVNAPGVPFIDLLDASESHVARLTKVYRAESDELVRLARRYRCGDPDYSPPTDSLAEHIQGAQSIVHMHDKDRERLTARIEDLVRQFKRNGDNFKFITYANLDCENMNDIVRKVYRPANEEVRLMFLKQYASFPRRSEKRYSLWGHIAEGDRALIRGGRWLHKNQCVHVESTSYEVRGTNVRQMCDIIVDVSKKQHKQFEKIVALKQKGKTTLWDDPLPDRLEPVRNQERRWMLSWLAKDLKPADCVTIHGAQGRQYDHVVYVRLQRVSDDCQEIYTAVSRAKKMLYLVGPIANFEMASYKVAYPQTILRRLMPGPRTFAELDNTLSRRMVEHVAKENSRVARKTIPENVRIAVWESHFPGQSTGYCAVCKRKLDGLRRNGWHLCHIDSQRMCPEKALDPKNMIPGCAPCNLKMHVKNLYDFMESMPDFRDRCTKVCTDENTSAFLELVTSQRPGYFMTCKNLKDKFVKTTQMQPHDVEFLCSELMRSKRIKTAPLIKNECYRICE